MINMEKTYEVYMIKDYSETKNNVYIIVDIETQRAAIVDPACSMEQINEIVDKFGLALDAVLVTHTHHDHVRCIHDLVNHYGCKVYVSRIEANYYHYNCNNIQLFDNEDIIIMGKTRIRCLLTPGHTAGSTCFLLDNSLFTGDTIFMEGCGMCTSKGASASSMFHSIERIKQQVGDFVLVYSGHTYNTQPGKFMSYLKENNIYFNIDDEKQFVEFRMRKNQRNLFEFK